MNQGMNPMKACYSMWETVSLPFPVSRISSGHALLVIIPFGGKYVNTK